MLVAVDAQEHHLGVRVGEGEVLVPGFAGVVVRAVLHGEGLLFLPSPPSRA